MVLLNISKMLIRTAVYVFFIIGVAVSVVCSLADTSNSPLIIKMWSFGGMYAILTTLMALLILAYVVIKERF